jgi:hypothetical protein
MSLSFTRSCRVEVRSRLADSRQRGIRQEQLLLLVCVCSHLLFL